MPVLNTKYSKCLLLWQQIQYLCPSGFKSTHKSNGRQSELNSFLWTIKRDPPSYFYGTIHVPYTRVWDYIPENSKKAFQESNIVYFELDLTDPYTISALTSCQLLPQGENLQDVLPRDIYRRLKRHLEYVKLMMPSWMTPDQRGKGLYADYLFNAIAGNWERKRPVWVMLMVNSLTEADIKTRGVPVLDLYLAQEAERMRKKTGAVEKVEEQCHPLNGLNFSQVAVVLLKHIYCFILLHNGGANQIYRENLKFCESDIQKIHHFWYLHIYEYFILFSNTDAVIYRRKLSCNMLSMWTDKGKNCKNV
uniref:Metalloprotease TIKI n=1 Tax=Astyanax mexicanus TaxID=7994 RepID=A0A8B9JN89_ASTMX